MSALWLVVPFAAGLAMARQREAIAMGLAATWLSVLAYAAMIVSPWEGTHLGPPPAGFHGSWNELSMHVFLRALSSQRVWFAGGLLSGPLTGLLGFEWRTRRHWAYALPVALALVFEPVAHWLAGRIGFNYFGGASMGWPTDGGGQMAEVVESCLGAVVTWWVIRVGRPTSRDPGVPLGSGSQ